MDTLAVWLGLGRTPGRKHIQCTWRHRTLPKERRSNILVKNWCSPNLSRGRFGKNIRSEINILRPQTPLPCAFVPWVWSGMCCVSGLHRNWVAL